MLEPSKYHLLSIVLVSVGCLCIMLGYDTQTFILEPVLHSVNLRDPQRIDPDAGYYGQAVINAIYTPATIVAPYLIHRIGAKASLIFSTMIFTAFNCGFLYINSLYYYVSSGILGLAFAAYYTGQGVYTAEHSTRATVSRNSAIIGSLGGSGPLFGGIILYTILQLTKTPSVEGVHGQDNQTIALDFDNGEHRTFSDLEINAIWGVLILVTVVGNIIMVFLPNKKCDVYIKKSDDDVTFKSQICKTLRAIVDPRMLRLSPFFFFYGCHVAFWISALPTTFSFAKQTADLRELPAYYSFCIGIGCLCIGAYINAFSRRFKSFGLIPTMLTQIVLCVAMYALAVAAVPNESTTRPTAQMAWLIQPGVWVCVGLGVLNGMIDCCNCTMRQFICTVAAPDISTQAFSVAKFYQSLSSCMFFFISPSLTINRWITLLGVCQVLSATGFIYQALKVRKSEMAAKKLEKGQGQPESSTIPFEKI